MDHSPCPQYKFACGCRIGCEQQGITNKCLRHQYLDAYHILLEFSCGCLMLETDISAGFKANSINYRVELMCKKHHETYTVDSALKTTLFTEHGGACTRSDRFGRCCGKPIVPAEKPGNWVWDEKVQRYVPH